MHATESPAGSLPYIRQQSGCYHRYSKRAPWSPSSADYIHSFLTLAIVHLHHSIESSRCRDGTISNQQKSTYEGVVDTARPIEDLKQITAKKRERELMSLSTDLPEFTGRLIGCLSTLLMRNLEVIYKMSIEARAQ